MLSLPKDRNYLKRGFTLIELLVVLGIITLLLGLVTVNLLSLHQQASIDSATNVLISDLKSQQMKSMSGVGSAGNGLYGIHINNDRYTFFRGANFSPADPGNFDVTLGGSLTAIASFANSQITFATSSGEVVNYNASQNTITVQDTFGKQKILTLNEYGTIISVN